VHILLEKFPGPVHLLLRAPSEHDAVLKMQGSFRQWDLGEFDPEQVGQGIHLAMTPMYHLPYEHFRRIWIPELERMIAFCGDHQAHSIWLILDIFLRTGYFFPFTFRIIPVDILADVIVFNVLKERERAGQSFNRPMLDEPVTDRLFSRTASNLLGLKEANLVAVREACLNKLRPSAAMVFMSNLNALLARKNETVTI
jgi:hypothetical protein